MRTWLATSLMALAGACTQAEAPEPGDTTPVYLALGDSVAFGYDPLVPERMTDGYPELVSQRLGVDVVNASCPGEATGGFVAAMGNDNGCRENKQAYPLHVEYDTTQL